MSLVKNVVEKAKPVLQVALDYTSLEDALRLAAALRNSLEPEEWLAEAGTPLIKSEGMLSVRLLSAVVSPTLVVADTKTADTGALEAELAAKNGASIVTVLGCVGDETIEEAARKAHELGLLLAVDLIGEKDPLRRIEELESLGADIVEIHVGIDAQRRLGLTAAGLKEIVARASKRFRGYIAVAGGLNEKTAPQMVEAGADIVIVGGAITKSPNPIAAARTILEVIREKRSSKNG